MYHTLILDTNGGYKQTLNVSNSHFRFNNIPFRQLVGEDEFSKYEYFNWELTEARFNLLANESPTQDEIGFNLVLSGANNLNQLVNLNYEPQLNLTSIVFPNLNFDKQYIIRFSNNTSFTMRKEANLQLELKYTDFVTGDIKTGSINYPDLSLTFKIIGVAEEQDT